MTPAHSLDATPYPFPPFPSVPSEFPFPPIPEPYPGGGRGMGQPSPPIKKNHKTRKTQKPLKTKVSPPGSIPTHREVITTLTTARFRVIPFRFIGFFTTSYYEVFCPNELSGSQDGFTPRKKNALSFVRSGTLQQSMRMWVSRAQFHVPFSHFSQRTRKSKRHGVLSCRAPRILCRISQRRWRPRW